MVSLSPFSKVSIENVNSFVLDGGGFSLDGKGIVRCLYVGAATGIIIKV